MRTRDDLVAPGPARHDLIRSSPTWSGLARRHGAKPPASVVFSKALAHLSWTSENCYSVYPQWAGVQCRYFGKDAYLCGWYIILQEESSLIYGRTYSSTIAAILFSNRRFLANRLSWLVTRLLPRYVRGYKNDSSIVTPFSTLESHRACCFQGPELSSWRIPVHPLQII